jgi:hypothetical protein
VKQSVRKGGPSNGVTNQMERGWNRMDQWNEQKELGVRELGQEMVAQR